MVGMVHLVNMVIMVNLVIMVEIFAMDIMVVRIVVVNWS